MYKKNYIIALTILLMCGDVLLQSVHIVFDDVEFIQNLDEFCLRCLCVAATNCDQERQCYGGYCGPYRISRIYWADSGRFVLPNDDPERIESYEDCVQNYSCAQQVVRKYLIKYGRDCNNDGVTDCVDFSMINFNGGWKCDDEITRNELGMNFSKRYYECVNV